MRFSVVVPVLLGLAGLVLSFLCLLSGAKVDFLPDYALLTLNTSEIGYSVIEDLSSSTIASALEDVLPTTIIDELEDDVDDIAQDLGLHDFYSYHIISYCDGYYTPTAVPNATVTAKDIHKNFTACSNTSAFFDFDPRVILQEELDAAGLSAVNVSDFDWPSSLDDDLAILHDVQKATFILYVIAIIFMAAATGLALASICFTGRLSACCNILVAWIAFIAIGIASALTTVIAVKGTSEINKYGTEVGISATVGGKFLALTWSATAAMFLTIIYWTFECIIGRRGHMRRNKVGQDYPDKSVI